MAKSLLSADEFRAKAQDGSATDVTVAMAGAVEIKAVEGDDRSLSFVLSNGDVDRQGDRVAQDGWDLANFRKNPVVMFGHDYDSLPVARASHIRVEDGALKATATFTPRGMAKFNDTVFDMIKAGFLNAVSVGFRPKKWNFAEDESRRMGMDFLEQELLEFSIVPIPAHPGALLEARAKGLDVGPIVDWAQQVLARAEGVDGDLRTLSADELAAFEADRAELRSIKAARLVEPDPVRFPRLTARALDLARVARAV